MKLQMKYKCEYCGKEYKRESNFKKHLESCTKLPTYNADIEEIKSISITDKSENELVTTETKERVYSESELYLIKFYTNFNKNSIIATPHQLNRLFAIYKELHNEDAGNRGCQGVQQYVVINLYNYWNKFIKIN